MAIATFQGFPFISFQQVLLFPICTGMPPRETVDTAALLCRLVGCSRAEHPELWPVLQTSSPAYFTAPRVTSQPISG